MVKGRSTSRKCTPKPATGKRGAPEPKSSRSKSKAPTKSPPTRGKAKIVARAVAKTTKTTTITTITKTTKIAKSAVPRGRAQVQAITSKTSKTLKSTEPANKRQKLTEDVKIEKLIKKGRAAVDKMVPNGNKMHVYEAGSKIYHSSLMWSDLKNNNNKFYIIQILQEDSNSNSFIVFNRWGRVGVDGQHANFRFNNSFAAIAQYNKKYNDKVGKGYTEIHIDFDEEDDGSAAKTSKGKKSGKGSSSKLHPRIQSLMDLIFDMKMMTQQMVEIGYDARKMPLGKLSKATIKQGYQALQKIADVLNKKTKGDLMDLSSDFFTVIPHDFGFKHMSQFVINTPQKLKEKTDMVAALGDIEIAHRLLETKGDENLSELDKNYKSLNCPMRHLDTKGDEFKMIQQYINNTKQYCNIDTVDIFKIDRDGEEKRYQKKIGNDVLLWHGSGISNFVGILSQGMRIAPPEAPCSGYNFGKGIYLADMMAKSMGYCRVHSTGDGCILLCRGACGNMHETCSGSYNMSLKSLPKGRHSTRGIGSFCPDPKHYLKKKDYMVPNNKPVQMNLKNSWSSYNEFIVYDVSQVKLEYLIRFNQKGY